MQPSPPSRTRIRVLSRGVLQAKKALFLTRLPALWNTPNLQCRRAIQRWKFAWLNLNVAAKDSFAAYKTKISKKLNNVSNSTNRSRSPVALPKRSNSRAQIQSQAHSGSVSNAHSSTEEEKKRNSDLISYLQSALVAAEEEIRSKDDIIRCQEQQLNEVHDHLTKLNDLLQANPKTTCWNCQP